jgi:hypothetical protein
MASDVIASRRYVVRLGSIRLMERHRIGFMFLRSALICAIKMLERIIYAGLADIVSSISYMQKIGRFSIIRTPVFFSVCRQKWVFQGERAGLAAWSTTRVHSLAEAALKKRLVILSSLR